MRTALAVALACACLAGCCHLYTVETHAAARRAFMT